MDITEIISTASTVNAEAVREKYRQLTLRLIEQKKTITTMESCTSGQIASLITDTEGSSAILRGAFVTYSNAAKIQMGVPPEIIEKWGVYSPQTACSMAETCRRAYCADIGIGVTGSFGNVDPNNNDSIPGQVFFAIAAHDETRCFHCVIPRQDSRLNYKLCIADLVVDQLL